MAEWRKMMHKWRGDKPMPADSTGVIEPIKARIVDLWASRPRFGPLWAYRWWWLKSWTLLLGSGLAVWQGSVMLARPSDPARLDDVMATVPTLHAVSTR